MRELGGAWIPADAKHRGDWFHFSVLLEYLAAIPVRHMLVIVDSCFASQRYRAQRTTTREHARLSPAVAARCTRSPARADELDFWREDTIDGVYCDELADALQALQADSMMLYRDGYFGELTYQDIVHRLLESGAISKPE